MESPGPPPLRRPPRLKVGGLNLLLFLGLASSEVSAEAFRVQDSQQHKLQGKTEKVCNIRSIVSRAKKFKVKRDLRWNIGDKKVWMNYGKILNMCCWLDLYGRGGFLSFDSLLQVGDFFKILTLWKGKSRFSAKSSFACFWRNLTYHRCSAQFASSLYIPPVLLLQFSIFWETDKSRKTKVTTVHSFSGRSTPKVALLHFWLSVSKRR